MYVAECNDLVLQRVLQLRVSLAADLPICLAQLPPRMLGSSVRHRSSAELNALYVTFPAITGKKRPGPQKVLAACGMRRTCGKRPNAAGDLRQIEDQFVAGDADP